ncbi:Arm DNA-binding domain-containing protein [Sphingorhabdus sp. EL138]|uniref:Arm DNA-binding domain-containing protein n=1 Tax=Sphingorhabdus sp. EL138 TaxID=2073156 RepID=UPI000D696BFA|nr:Arm DNA-binding domain-containing protein [Sphingorhabdus sp. EL138]
MTKLTKRAVEALKSKNSDYFVWDDELLGFGLRIFRSGKRSYLIQYRSDGRSRRYTIGQHGVWTAETARREARKLLGKIAEGENPAEQRHLDNNSIIIKELCERYLADADIRKNNHSNRSQTGYQKNATQRCQKTQRDCWQQLVVRHVNQQQSEFPERLDNRHCDAAR